MSEISFVRNELLHRSFCKGAFPINLSSFGVFFAFIEYPPLQLKEIVLKVGETVPVAKVKPVHE